MNEGLTAGSSAFSQAMGRVLEENAELWQALADLDTHTSNTDSPHIDSDWVHIYEIEGGFALAPPVRRSLWQRIVSWLKWQRHRYVV